MLVVNLLTVFLLTVVLAYGLAAFAPKLNLLAMPGAHRRHTSPTPMVGGIAICGGLVAGFLIIDSSFGELLICLSLLCFVGVLDDRYSLPFWLRFVMQGVAAYLMIKLTGVELLSLGSLVSEREVQLNEWSTAVTIFAVIGVINAINMSDGLDGLAGGLVFVVMLSLLLIGSPDATLLLVGLAAVTGFLSWNLRLARAKAKIFLGDAGSTMLGLLLAYLLIRYSQMNNNFQPVSALWFLALPLIDAVTVLLIRPLRGRSPFSADLIHYHHQLRDKGLGANAILVTVLLMQLILIFLGIVLMHMGVQDRWQLGLFLALFAAYFVVVLIRTKPVS